MNYIMKCPERIPYLKNGDNKVILDFSIDQHECSYYIDIWNVLCGVIQDANNMKAFPYGDTLFAIGVKLKEGKSYSVILTKYNLYVLGFADFNEGPEIQRGSDVVIFDMEAVAYPRSALSQGIDIKDSDILTTQFQNMYSFWEQIKSNQNNNAIDVLKNETVHGQRYLISFLIVVWFISEAAREETGRIAWLMNLKHQRKIDGTIVNSIPGLTQNIVQDIYEQCRGLFRWQENKNCIFTKWDTIAKEGDRTNYITVPKIAEHYHIPAQRSIVEKLKGIYDNE